MRKILAGLCVVGAFAVVGCGGDDKGSETATPLAACQSIVHEICSKYFGCLTKDQRTLLAGVIGNNEADCRTKFEQDNCTDQKLKCDSGETYSSAKAQECLDQYKSYSCDEFGNGNAPAACDAVCG
jgi:hypothetical protein